MSVQFQWMCRARGRSGKDCWWCWWQAGPGCFCQWHCHGSQSGCWQSLRGRFASGVASALSHQFTIEKNGMGLREALASLFLLESCFTSFFYSLMSFCSTFNLFSSNPKKFSWSKELNIEIMNIWKTSLFTQESCSWEAVLGFFPRESKDLLPYTFTSNLYNSLACLHSLLFGCPFSYLLVKT